MTEQMYGLLFVFAFVVFMLFMFKRMAVKGGWAELARRYPDKQPGGEKRTIENFRMKKGGRYGKSTTLQCSQEGIRFSQGLFSRFGHSPFFVPWSELSISDIAPTEKEQQVLNKDFGSPERNQKMRELLERKIGSRKEMSFSQVNNVQVILELDDVDWIEEKRRGFSS